MSRRFLVLNVLLLAVAAAAGVYIAREFTTLPRKLPPARAAKAESAAAATTASGEASASRSAGSYTVVAARNLFSPTRSETPPDNVLAVAVWDGHSRGADDLTAEFIRAARTKGLDVEEIATL